MESLPFCILALGCLQLVKEVVDQFLGTDYAGMFAPVQYPALDLDQVVDLYAEVDPAVLSILYSLRVVPFPFLYERGGISVKDSFYLMGFFSPKDSEIVFHMLFQGEGNLFKACCVGLELRDASQVVKVIGLVFLVCYQKVPRVVVVDHAKRLNVSFPLFLLPWVIIVEGDFALVSTSFRKVVEGLVFPSAPPSRAKGDVFLNALHSLGLLDSHLSNDLLYQPGQRFVQVRSLIALDGVAGDEEGKNLVFGQFDRGEVHNLLGVFVSAHALVERDRQIPAILHELDIPLDRLGRYLEFFGQELGIRVLPSA